ncbi:14010_t:CDS:2 [Entrophospora sp. SA101]|nr:14010_t:CDS:2 [Entrophospora sp. SA101]
MEIFLFSQVGCMKDNDTGGKMLKEIKSKYENYINNAYQHEFERGYLTPERNISNVSDIHIIDTNEITPKKILLDEKKH